MTQNNGINIQSSQSSGVQQVRYAQWWGLAIIYIHTGCEKLAVIEENIVTAFVEIGGDSNSAITITLNRTYRVRSSALRIHVP